MSDIKLFRIQEAHAIELPGHAAGLERSLQRTIEENLETLLGVRFLKSEYSTGAKHRGRIDTLGLDENGCPVIIEYKRNLNENVINQGLFYLDWLLDHRGEFELLVLKELGESSGETIDWSAPRLICIAEDFTRYDEHAISQIQRNIELIRYRYFQSDLLLLEMVNSVTPATGSASGRTPTTKGEYKTITDTLETLSGELRDLYDDLGDFNRGLGDDVQEKVLKYYVAFKRIRNFCCVEVHPQKKALTLFLHLDPDETELVPDFTRDVRKIGHYGTGDLEVTVRNQDDLERTKELIRRSFERS